MGHQDHDLELRSIAQESADVSANVSADASADVSIPDTGDSALRPSAAAPAPEERRPEAAVLPFELPETAQTLDHDAIDAWRKTARFLRKVA